MSRKVWIALVVIALVGAAIWYFSGGVERVTQSRVGTALTDKGVPPKLASCMAEKMANQLTIGQLRALENLAPREGEPEIPRLPGEAIARLQRVGDPQAVKITMRAGWSARSAISGSCISPPALWMGAKIIGFLIGFHVPASTDAPLRSESRAVRSQRPSALRFFFPWTV